MADVFRTPDERFVGLPGYDFAPHWHEAGGLRPDPGRRRAGAGRGGGAILQEDRGEEIAERIVEFTGGGGS